MEQLFQIKAKYSEGDRLFALQENLDEPNYLIPVSVNGVSNIKILGADYHVITYSVSTIKNRIGLEISEINLYPIDEIERFLK